MSMLDSTSLARKRLMSAPAEKNFSLALRTTMIRVWESSPAARIAWASSCTNSIAYELAGGLSSVIVPSAPVLA